MYIFIIIIHIIVCFILIAAILLQSGRGGGLSGLFGGGTSQTIFGTRASTFLTRATTVAATLFLFTCISLTIFSSWQGRSLFKGKTDQLNQDYQTRTSLPLVTEETEGEEPLASEEQAPIRPETED